MFESPYTHFQRGDVVAEYASFDFLLPPEETILSLLRDRLREARVLDVGVGAGRTAHHLAPLAAAYVGTDVSPPMVEACRRRFDGRPGISFRALDVRDMAPLEDESFDLVLFSFNGLDVVGDHEDRRRALTEMRRVCRNGGLLCFSSHNLAFARASCSYLHALRLMSRAPAARRAHPIVQAVRTARSALRRAGEWRRLNPEWRSLGDADHALIVEERPRYELAARYYDHPHRRIRIRKYYVRPTAQVRRLRSDGFERVRVFATDGREITGRILDEAPHDWWLYYLATRSDGPR